MKVALKKSIIKIVCLTALQQSLATSQNEIPLNKMMCLCAVNIDLLLYKYHELIMVQLLSLKIPKTFKSGTTFLFSLQGNIALFTIVDNCIFPAFRAERNFLSLI